MRSEMAGMRAEVRATSANLRAAEARLTNRLDALRGRAAAFPLSETSLSLERASPMPAGGAGMGRQLQRRQARMPLNRDRAGGCARLQGTIIASHLRCYLLYPSMHTASRSPAFAFPRAVIVHLIPRLCLECIPVARFPFAAPGRPAACLASARSCVEPAVHGLSQGDASR